MCLRLSSMNIMRILSIIVFWAITTTQIVAKDLTIQTSDIQRVIDGDTFYYKKEDQGSVVKVRIIGIDAPELGQEYREYSKKVLSKILLNPDIKQLTLKCYGRSFSRDLCSVYISGIDLAGILVMLGAAWDVEKYSNGQYKQAQKTAQAKKSGLWSGENPIPPWLWREGKR